MMQLFFNLILLLYLVAQCKDRSVLAGNTRQPGRSSPKGATYPSTTVPPKDLQTGGADFFARLEPVAKTHPHASSSDRIFMNQTIDLEQLGPGANVIFVADGRNWAFALSNGRFDAIEQIGSLSDRTYPSETPEKEGKYPWPVDHQGRWLPGERLVTSNGPHGSLEEALKAAFGSTSLFGGHLGVENGGRAYIGYVSGSASGNHVRGDLAKDLDGRAMAVLNRKAFHAVISKATTGRGISEILRQAPEEDGAFNGYSSERQKRMAQFHPFTGSGFSTQATSRSALELLFRQLGAEQTRGYLGSLAAAPLGNLIFHPNIKKSLKAVAGLEELIHFFRSKFARPAQVASLLANKNYETLRRAILTGTEIHASDFANSDFLVWAAEFGDDEIVEKLIAAGASLDVQNIIGSTALIWAALKGHTEIAAKLISAGADLDVQNWYDLTALNLAARKGHTEIAGMLIAAGASLDVQDKDGFTALIWAAHVGHTEIAAKLIAAGADLKGAEKLIADIPRLQEATLQRLGESACEKLIGAI